MCVSQFADYVNAHALKPECSLTKNDEIQRERGSKYVNGWVIWYTKNTREMNRLAKLGNPYAVADKAVAL